MNKQFVLKMLEAKQLQYEALKEIMPENIVDHFKVIENELIEIGKEYFMKAVYNATDNNKDKSSEAKDSIRKVTIE